MGSISISNDSDFVDRINKHNIQAFKLNTVFNVQDIKFPLYTQGINIVDSAGKKVKLSGANWSGSHLTRHCVDGLQCRALKDIALDIRNKFKMNCIRLTYSLQMFFDNNVISSKYLKANTQLIGKTSMQIFDYTIKVLTEVGLMVILNNHISSSQWCCSNDDGNGLWWTNEYPETKFFQCAEQFAKRYKDNPRVIGMDLRNQIRRANNIEPTWGSGNLKTDWKIAAQTCAQKVLINAPHWLIFIGGLNYQLDLTGVQKYPIKLSVPNRLVYTGHFYGFSWSVPDWSKVSYDQFKKKMFNTQTFVRSFGYPYLLGEFGNNQRDVPWNYVIEYLKETGIDWTVWCLDGFKGEQDKDESYGLFTNDFKQVRHPELLQDLISVSLPSEAVTNCYQFEQL